MICSFLPFHPFLPFVLGEEFDGIAESRARHFVNMLFEEVGQLLLAATLTYFAQHPPYGFVHQVVWMMEQYIGIMQSP